MKSFIITIDTEGDNLWSWKPGNPVFTENTMYLMRFQSLANNYGFYPTWLSNYEMLNDDRFVDFISKVEAEKIGELGMHLHAWNTPPIYHLPIENNGAPYLIEYPVEVMEEKIATMTDTIKNKTGIIPVSHRAGRWALDNRYIQLLIKYGYKVDCSVTPHKDWSSYPGQSDNSFGSDYSSYAEEPFYLDKDNRLLEVPMTIRRSHHLFFKDNGSFKNKLGSIYRGVKGQTIWLRPNGHNLKEMISIVNQASFSNSDYVMFMLHSSELMPGGSPTFKNSVDIEKMYLDCEEVFNFASKCFAGVTLRDYASKISGKVNI